MTSDDLFDFLMADELLNRSECPQRGHSFYVDQVEWVDKLGEM